MKALLLYGDRDFGTILPLPAACAALRADLDLDVLARIMADGDEYLRDVADAVLPAGLASPNQIRYRQDVLTDCIRQPGAIRAIYDVATSAVEAEQRIWSSERDSPGYTLHRSLQAMDLFLPQLRRLRELADERVAGLTSAGLTRLLGALRAELSDAYLAEIAGHLRAMRGPDVLASAALGPAGEVENEILYRPERGRTGLLARLSPGSRETGYELVVPDRDVAGRQTLNRIRDQAISAVASALAQSCGQIRDFFAGLRFETGFYLGCLNLHAQLSAVGRPLCWPEPRPAGERALAARDLADPALLLTRPGPVVGNDLSADGKSLVIITGANQGGKTTFLRSLGLAQLMMQAGLFVVAGSFTAAISTSVRSHFPRPEDATMTSGKLEDELRRMGLVVDAIMPGGLLLCNESFAATNEREGSDLARGVIRAMLDCGVRVFLVTHFHELASGFHADRREDTLFLRADRQPDGTRTFRITPGPPLQTSHARDIYDQVLGAPLT